MSFSLSNLKVESMVVGRIKVIGVGMGQLRQDIFGAFGGVSEDGCYIEGSCKRREEGLGDVVFCFSGIGEQQVHVPLHGCASGQ